METLFQYVSPPSRCGYLPRERWSMEYELVAKLSPEEYLDRLLGNWRRFGHTLFRPVCADCRACRSLRVEVAHFRPDRSQRRCRRANAGEVTLTIGTPSVTRAKLALYDRYHAHQAHAKGWPQHPAKDAASYAESFVHQPFPVEEWCYHLGGRLVGVGYVDPLPGRGGRAADAGLSAIYFYYEPGERERGLGTWNVLCLIDEARRRGLPYLYLGYYVEGCLSLSYKARFAPNQIRGPEGQWRPFRD
jgi:arginyl-tRNA--protein-N-Asp/Glu arginylyltransferase